MVQILLIQTCLAKLVWLFLKQIELRESFRESYRQSVDGYLTIIQQINIQIIDVSKDIDQIAKLDDQAQILMSISGIGALLCSYCLK